MTVVTEILNRLSGVNKPQAKFLSVLFSTMLVCNTKINFLSLSRYSALSEKTYRRQFQKQFDFAALNLQTAEKARLCNPIAFAQDASFIKKSGKHTFGLAKFWNSTARRAEKGLEVSLIALIDTEQNASFALSAEQTPAAPENDPSQTRIDFYLAHLERTRARFPDSVRYGVFDGFYAKEKFVRQVCNLGLDVISRFRTDANLRYFYTGAKSGKRGRPKRFDGKVDFEDLSRFERVQSSDAEIQLYTARLWSVGLKRAVRVVIVKSQRQRIYLFSTDVELSAKEILRLYQLRFSIEFLFRDAKQSAGLESAQARNKDALSFHWNASFATVNLARAIAAKGKDTNQELIFSMRSIKQQIFNEHLLDLFISKLGLDSTLIKNHEQYEKLRNYAVISP